MQQLGKALTIIAQQRAKEDAMHMDVDAFHGGSECHLALMDRESQRRRRARKHAEAVARMPWRVLVGKLGKHQLGNRNFLRLEEICLSKATGGRLGR